MEVRLLTVTEVIKMRGAAAPTELSLLVLCTTMSLECDEYFH